MSKPSPASYCFLTCKVGAQHALKNELASLRPEWHPAYARPGFVSFKAPPGTLDPGLPLDSIFALTRSVSLGTASVAEAPALLHEAMMLVTVPQSGLSTPPRLHCWARSVSETREAPNPLDPVAAGLEAKLLASGRFQRETAAADGELVMDVLVVDADRVIFGCHRHDRSHSPYPGGKPRLHLPEDAPSRAWLKFEEALLWHPRRMVSGQLAVEIGSAPGGTAYGLLARGLELVSIDPAAMDERLELRHIRKLANNVERGELPPAFDWLLIDINDNPGSTLRLAERFIRMSATRPALILTLKTANWQAYAQVPDFRRRLARLGYRGVLARQLYHGRREIVLLG